MSLNDLNLSPASIAALYAQVLVETPGTSRERVPSTGSRANSPGTAGVASLMPGSAQAATPELPGMLGQFRQKILILVRYPDIPHLPDAPLAFLLSILSACKLGIADVGIVNVSPVDSYRHLQTTYKPRVMLLCGIAPQSLEMPLDFPQFQVQPFDNCTFLFSPALEEIENDKVLKSKLWVCLRKVFNL